MLPGTRSSCPPGLSPRQICVGFLTFLLFLQLTLPHQITHAHAGISTVTPSPSSLLHRTQIATYGNLQGAVRKHRDTIVDRNAIQKLAKFDHLIRYFCHFSYFVAHHKVSPDFLRALILAESSANPRATSPKDARGLGQIIYPTGRKAAQELSGSRTHFRYVSKNKLANLKPADLYDPAINILLTCYLIAKYNHKFQGKLELVVSAWNAGEYTESLQQGRHAAYAETEDLIAKINAYYVYLLRNRTFQ